MRLILVAIVALSAVACSRQDQQTPAADAARAPPETVAAQPAPVGPPAYEGRWAVSPDLCAQGAWDFRQDGVSTAGEVSCAFREVEPSASGYRIQAACTHEGSESDSEIGLSITDPAPPQSMTVTGGPWNGPVTLRRCPA